MHDVDQYMDELFRKAADNYPLKVDDGGWDDISGVLLNKPADNPVAKKKGSRKFIVLLLFLLPLFLNDGIITNIKAVDTSQRVGENENNTPMMASKTPGTRTTNSNTNFVQKQKTGIEFIIRQKDHPLIVAQKLPELTSAVSNTSTAPVKSFKQEAFSVNDKMTNEKDLLTQKENPEPVEIPIPEKQDSYLKRLYMGVTTGVLFNEVKNQGLAGTGFSIGIIAGYQFNKHLSLETGLVFAKKPYYSDGKYFSMDKVSSAMPAGMEIVSLEGNNSVWEIAIRTKYDFLERNKTNLFTTVGITSYVMTHEKNNYLVAMSGVQQTMNSSYKNKSRSLAATLDVSVGYEHKIGKSNYFRIEPYIQFPLKGMGVGSMQMISTGLRIGVTKFTN